MNFMHHALLLKNVGHICNVVVVAVAGTYSPMPLLQVVFSFLLTAGDDFFLFGSFVLFPLN